MTDIAVTDRIPLVDLNGQYRRIEHEIHEAIRGVLESSQFIKGPVLTSFEEELASYLSGRFAIGVGNGTDALQLALMALGVGPGDEVITSPFSFVAAAEVTALLGATPVFGDIKQDSFNLDPESVEPLINENTKAIIPVHLFGQPAEIESFIRMGDAHGIPIIEDAAQAIGATFGGRKVGFLGDIGILSFFPSKNLGAFGDGGAVLTNDEALAASIRTIANHGAEKKYYNNLVGVNSRLDAIQAAILHVKLRHLDEYIGARVEAADRYDALLADVERITAPARLPGRTHVFHQYTIRVESSDPEPRNQLAAALKDDGIATALYYPVPIHQLDPYRDCPRPAAGLPETERACAQVLSLPMHTELTVEQTSRVVDRISAHIADILG